MYTQTEHLFKVAKSFKLFSFQDTKVYSFELGGNFLTLPENVTCKRNLAYKSCNTGFFG